MYLIIDSNFETVAFQTTYISSITVKVLYTSYTPQAINICYAHQGYIYWMKNTVKTVILQNIINM